VGNIHLTYLTFNELSASQFRWLPHIGIGIWRQFLGESPENKIS